MQRRKTGKKAVESTATKAVPTTSAMFNGKLLFRSCLFCHRLTSFSGQTVNEENQDKKNTEPYVGRFFVQVAWT
jgi:cytochrome c2